MKRKIWQREGKRETTHIYVCVYIYISIIYVYIHTSNSFYPLDLSNTLKI